MSTSYLITNYPNMRFIDTAPFAKTMPVSFQSVQEITQIIFFNYYKLLEFDKNMKLNIIHNDNFSCPQTFRFENIIFLNFKTITEDGTVMPFCHFQYAFQLSHEFCHYLIPSNVVDNLRWFEESICHMASYYFIKKSIEYLSSVKENINSKKTLLFFKQYYDSMNQDGPPIDLGLFSNPDTEEFKKYLHSPELVYQDNYIALRLLPIFQANEMLWNIVPHLCEIPGNLSLSKTFDRLELLTNKDCSNGINQLKLLFKCK